MVIDYVPFLVGSGLDLHEGVGVVGLGEVAIRPGATDELDEECNSSGADEPVRSQSEVDSEHVDVVDHVLFRVTERVLRVSLAQHPHSCVEWTDYPLVFVFMVQGRVRPVDPCSSSYLLQPD